MYLQVHESMFCEKSLLWEVRLVVIGLLGPLSVECKTKFFETAIRVATSKASINGMDEANSDLVPPISNFRITG